MPSFSAYPQEAVTNAGEYLLSLPQTLEQVAEAREMERASARAAAEARVAEEARRFVRRGGGGGPRSRRGGRP